MATKTVLKGSNKGREYYCCSNAIPCGHFRWVPQKVPLPTGRLAGDANQSCLDGRGLGRLFARGTRSGELPIAGGLHSVRGFEAKLPKA